MSEREGGIIEGGNSLENTSYEGLTEDHQLEVLELIMKLHAKQFKDDRKKKIQRMLDVNGVDKVEYDKAMKKLLQKKRRF